MDIRQVTPIDEEALQLHMQRHRAESGRGDYHFMPFAPDDTAGPSKIDWSNYRAPLTEPNWRRDWVAWHGNDIVGHIDLKASALKSQVHRCELGVGIERNYRNQGLGRALMHTAIRFGRSQESIAWIDLRVFAHNENARHLYASLGFEEIGQIRDCIRIGSTSIDDVFMALNVE